MTCLETEIQDGVAVVTLNRPERRNALSGELVQTLIERFSSLQEDTSVRAVVLTGKGKVFCAGGDLADGLSGGDGVLASQANRGRYAELLALLPALRVPVVAALNGDALGGGLGLAMACDLVVAARSARLGTPEIRLGLFPMVITAVLQRNVPRKVLLDMMLRGRKLSAERAEAVGMVNEVVDEGAALEAATMIAQELAGKSAAIMALGKAAFYQVEDMSLDDALSYLNVQLTVNLLTEDALEGVSAFLQKRTPDWKGR
jgi:enoyl-CoA hydratase